MIVNSYGDNLVRASLDLCGARKQSSSDTTADLLAVLSGHKLLLSLARSLTLSDSLDCIAGTMVHTSYGTASTYHVLDQYSGSHVHKDYTWRSNKVIMLNFMLNFNWPSLAAANFSY